MALTTSNKTVQQLIDELTNLRDDVKDLPILIQQQNGLITNPDVKLFFNDGESPLYGDSIKGVILV